MLLNKLGITHSSSERADRWTKQELVIFSDLKIKPVVILGLVINDYLSLCHCVTVCSVSKVILLLPIESESPQSEMVNIKHVGYFLNITTDCRCAVSCSGWIFSVCVQRIVLVKSWNCPWSPRFKNWSGFENLLACCQPYSLAHSTATDCTWEHLEGVKCTRYWESATNKSAYVTGLAK